MWIIQGHFDWYFLKNTFNISSSFEEEVNIYHTHKKGTYRFQNSQMTNSVIVATNRWSMISLVLLRQHQRLIFKIFECWLTGGESALYQFSVFLWRSRSLELYISNVSPQLNGKTNNTTIKIFIFHLILSSQFNSSEILFVRWNSRNFLPLLLSCITIYYISGISLHICVREWMCSNDYSK